MKQLYIYKNSKLHDNIYLMVFYKLKEIMNLKAIYTLLIVMLLSVIFTGCSDDFLNKAPLTTLSDESFWKSEKDATMGIMGCYDELQQPWVYNGEHWEGSFATHIDGIAGDAVYRWDWQIYEWYARNNVSPNAWMYQMHWMVLYQGIARCNNAIANIEVMTQDQIDILVKDRLLAEAKFLRALLYNLLVTSYHDVPLVTKPQVATDLPSKSKRDKIVAFLQTDLLSSLNNLPAVTNKSEWGRATQGAAYALLAKLNLLNIGHGGDYVKVAEYTKKVMNTGVYNLYPNYEKLFKWENEINNEIVFPVVFQRGPNDTGGKFVATWGPEVGNYWIYPLSNLVDDYYCLNGKPIKDKVTNTLNSQYNPNSIWENRDPRLSGTIVGTGALWNGKVITASDMSAEPTGFSLRKWREESGSDDRFDSPQDFYIFRYAHILLMRAEALIMSGNINDPDVNSCINAVRARVGMPSVEKAEGAIGALNQDAYMNIIRHEWRVETAFEGWSFDNVRRWGKLQAAYEKVNETDFLKFPAIVRKHIYAPRLEVYPIPQSEMDRNSNLVQNDLWK